MITLMDSFDVAGPAQSAELEAQARLAAGNLQMTLRQVFKLHG
jgi:hypothetical protein